jgi:two-component sensor histidine kinase
VESITLIANELVTNAAKHAFAQRGGGAIELGFRQEGAGWRLWVYDNGRGLPADAAQDQGKSFGRQLLATLAARLNAEVRSVADRGTKVEVFSGLTG